MQLFKITTTLIGKDMNKTATVGFLVAEDELAVLDHLDTNFCSGDLLSKTTLDDIEYDERVCMLLNDKSTATVDIAESEYFTQHYAWETCVDLLADDVVCLKRHGLLIDLQRGEHPTYRDGEYYVTEMRDPV